MKMKLGLPSRGSWSVIFSGVVGLLLSLAIGWDSPHQTYAQDADTADIQHGDAAVDDGGENAVDADGLKQPWIGVGASPVDDGLRAHLELPGNSGLMIRQIIPDSPADKAGLNKYDILLRADKNPLASAQDLVDVVRTWNGETDGIKVEWMRKGVEMSEIITPVERPNAAQLGFGLGDLPAMQNQLENQLGQQLGQRFGQLQGQNGEFRFHILGPGLQAGSKTSQTVNENGVKITIERENENPAKISVEDGESSWEITENDLNELPADIKQKVEAMLKGTSGSQIDILPLGQIPNIQIPNVQIPNMRIPDFEQMQQEFKKIGIPMMEERFDEMERQLEKMLDEIERIQPLAPPADEAAVDPNHDA